MNYALVKPADALAHAEENTEANIELREALRNAVSQIERLNKYRISQKTRNEDLQQRLAQMNSELDATVDALRRHQSSTDVERRRTASEIGQLRTQLTKATVILEHHHLLPPADNSAPKKAASANPRIIRHSRSQVVPNSQQESSSVELSLLQQELLRLQSDMTQQKIQAEHQITALRGELTESTADNRALRTQLTRLLSQTGQAASFTITQSGNIDLSCVNCQRLERLLDILQKKTAPKLAKTVHIDWSGGPTSPIRSDNTFVEFPYPANYPQCQSNHLSELEQSLQHQKQTLEKMFSDLNSERETFNNERNVFEVVKQQTIARLEADGQAIANDALDVQNQMIQIGIEWNQLREEQFQLSANPAHMSAPEPVPPWALTKRADVAIQCTLLKEIESNCLANGQPQDCEAYIVGQSSYQSFDQTPTQLQGIEDWSDTNHMENVCFSTTTSSSSIFPDSSQQLFDLLGEQVKRRSFNLPTAFTDSIDSSQSSSEHVKKTLLQLYLQVHNEWAKLEQEKARFHRLQEKSVTVLPEEELTSSAALEASVDAVSDPNAVNTITLLKKLRASEEEKFEATEQLKASNAEFLLLRERVSHAQVERAYLKETVEGLDDQVTHLETALYERSEELRRCRTELSRLQKYSLFSSLSPSFTQSAPVSSGSVIIRLENLLSDISHNRFAVFPNPRILAVRQTITRLRMTCLHRLRLVITWFLSKSKSILPWKHKLVFRGQPRFQMLLLLFIYFVVIHFLLLRIWFL